MSSVGSGTPRMREEIPCAVEVGSPPYKSGFSLGIWFSLVACRHRKAGGLDVCVWHISPQISAENQVRHERIRVLACGRGRHLPENRTCPVVKAQLAGHNLK